MGFKFFILPPSSPAVPVQSKICLESSAGKLAVFEDGLKHLEDTPK